MNEIKVDIPHCYLWMTDGYHDRDKLFKEYVQGYIQCYYPHLEYKKISGMKAICERRQNNG
ncbi:hypothetical protein [Metabacillus bambusae]|uniref:Transposase n=1 Tax=Metabacillus bambusae TaxID=2795218 RepID=A0ABS3N4T4_9BACI|nr:hypothetical protein [Metabacillus bambusae]MBO1513228.1 hypothetical protein [Metabacillus bambusae]